MKSVVPRNSWTFQGLLEAKALENATTTPTNTFSISPVRVDSFNSLIIDNQKSKSVKLQFMSNPFQQIVSG